MATLDELQQQLNALQQKVDAITAPPTDYYTQRYSGEETDRGVEIALGLDPDGTGIVTPEHGGTGASTPQAALAALGAGVRPNLFDNAYFIGGGSQQGGGQFPVNQRGQTSYLGPGYAIDRWKIPGDGGTLTVNKNGIAYQNTTEYTPYLLESLELSRLIPGGQYTMSALFAGGSATKAVEFVCFRHGSPGYSVFTGNAVEGAGLSSVTFTVPEDTTALEARMTTGPYGTKGDFTAVAAKLELGPTQTLAYQDSDGNWQLLETPDYVEELAKCQRYQIVYSAQGALIPWSGYNANSLWSCIFLPEEMRITPSIGGGTISICGVGESISVPVSGFSISLFLFGNLLIIRADKAAHGLTTYTATIQFNNLILDANL